MALEVDADAPPNERILIDAIWGAVTRLYGEVGASLAGLVLINYDGKSAILRVNLVAVDKVRAALASLISIEGKNVAVHVLVVSGTIKALCRKLK